MTSATVQVDTGGNGGSTSFTHRGGVVARYVDTSNYLQAYVTDQASNDLAPLVELRKNVAGTITSLLSASLPLSSNYYNLGASTARLRVTVSPSGVVGVWAHLGTGDFIGSPLLMTYDADLATGGALASGKCGIYDENRAATSWKYDSFWAAATVDDAALFASRTLTISSAGVLRRDAGNAVSGAPRSYEGTYLRIPPAGPEGRTLRVIVKASRVEPGIADPGLDDISATLSYTPRYLVIP
jgi:hypothetical protein